MHKRCIVKLDKEERKQLAELVKKEKVAAKKPTLCRRSKRASLPAAPRTNPAAERQYSLRPPLLPHYVMQNIVYQNIDVVNHMEREVQS